MGVAEDDEETGGGRTGKGRARQAISDKRAAELGKKKKSTMNVRTAVLYKKSFAQLLEESVGAVSDRLRGFADGSIGYSFIPCHDVDVFDCDCPTAERTT